MTIQTIDGNNYVPYDEAQALLKVVQATDHYFKNDGSIVEYMNLRTMIDAALQQTNQQNAQ